MTAQETYTIKDAAKKYRWTNMCSAIGRKS